MTQVLFDRLKSNLAQCINDGTIYFVTDSNGNFTQIALGDGSKSHVVGIGPKMDDATKQELMSKLGLTISSDMGTIQLGKLANHNGVSSQKVVTYERTGLGTDVHEISNVGYVQQYLKTAKAMVYAGLFNAQTKEITDYNNAIISPSEEGNVTFDYLLNGNEGETLLTTGMSFIVGTAGNLEGYTGISVYGGETKVEVGDMIIIINVHPKEGDEGGSTYNEASILIMHNKSLDITEFKSGIIYDVSAHNNGAVFESLSALLSDGNLSTLIPTSVRRGGMSIKFIQSSDNKYVQYMLTKQIWSVNVDEWEKTNLEEEITELNNELVSQRIKEITPQIISGLIALSSSSIFQTNSNYKILTVQVKVGDKIKLQYPVGILNICWSEEVPVLNGSYSGFYSTRNQSSFYDALIYEVTSEIDGYLCVSATNTYNVKFYKENNTYAVDVKDELVNLQSQVDLLQGELVEGDSITIKTEVIDGFCAYKAGYLIPKTDYKAVVFFARANKEYRIITDDSNSIYIGRTLFYPYPNCTITDFTTFKSEKYIQPNTDTYIIVCMPTDTTVTVTITNTYIGKDVVDLKEGLVQTKESIEEVGSNLTNLNKTLNEQVLNDNEFITIQDEIRTELTISTTSSKVERNSNYSIYAIPVTKGDKIFVTCNKTALGNMSFIVGYTDDIPALDVSCYDVILNEKTRWTDEEVVASRTGYYCISCNNSIDIIEFKSLNSGLARRVKVLEDIVPHEGTINMSSKIITPSTVYELCPNNAFVALNRIYVEGLTATSDSDFNNSLMVDGRKNLFITNPSISDTTKEYNISLLLSADGYENKTITVPIRRTQPLYAKNKTINVMCIGDSLTQGGYPSIVEYIFKRLNDNQSDTLATMIGTSLLNTEIEYNGITKTCRGCHEGKGGAGISDYMRHLFMVRVGSKTDNRYGMTISGKAAWDSLGLGTKTRNGSAGQPYETYTGSAEQKELMRTTCHGYYDADPSQELWNWRSVCYPEYDTFIYDGITYTFGSSYSSDENAKIIAFVKWMCESDVFGIRRFKFYDKNTVESSNGQYSFNLSKYIDRFKTLDNDGITRLVVGDTAGTLVTNVTSYDVCKPTHVIIIMNHNDLVQYKNVSGVISDLCLMADLVKEYDSNIHIALGSNRAYGSIEPKVYYDTIGMVGNFGANFTILRDFYVALKDCGAHGDILNIYQTSTVKGAFYQAVDTMTHADATLYNGDDAYTHTQLKFYLDRAYQIAAWIISKLES